MKSVHTLPIRQKKSPFHQGMKVGDWSALTAKVTRRSSVVRVGEQFDVPTIYGSIVSNTLIDANPSSAEVGLYEIPKSGASQSDMLFSGPKASYGGVLVDNIYYATDLMSFFGWDYIMIYGYDVTTGSNEVYIDGSINNLAPAGITTDPTTGTLYGIFYTDDKQNLQLGTITYSADGATTTPIKVLEGQWNSICCDGKGQLFAISYEGELKDGKYTVTSCSLQKLDKKTGEATKIGEMEGYAPQYLSSCVIDPKTGTMYWNYCPADGTSYMCVVNTETAETTTLYKLALNDEIMGMYIPTPAADAKAPGECASFHANFEGNSLEGELTLTAPSTLFDGSAASGDVNVTVLVSGKEVMNEKVSYGEECKVPVNVEEAGTYTFTVFASNDAGEGPRSNLKHVWVGPDTPSATKVTLKYEDGKMDLSWNAVTSGINGGYLDLDNLTYTITRYPGANVVATDYKSTTFEEVFPAPTESLDVIYYTVTASCNGLVSAPAQSETVTLGNIVPPYLNKFDSENDLGGWKTEDANGDDVTWFWEGTDGGDMRNSFNDDQAADDWFISPAVKLKKGKAYYVSIDTRGTSTSWTERVELKYGRTQTAAGMTKTLAGPLEMTNNVFESLGGLLVPEEDGIYYIGIHGISDAANLDLVADNFSIEDGISAYVPSAPEDLKISPDIYGKLAAEISFTAPAVDLQGNALTSLTKVEVMRGDEKVKEFSSPAVGEELKFTDTLPEEGVYSYTVIGYNEEGKGLSIEGSNYVGVNLPTEPLKVRFDATPGSGLVTLQWDAIETDIHGNPMLAENVTYTVYDVSGEVVVLAEGLKECSYTYQAVPEGEQKFIQCAVCAVTSAGEGEPGYSEITPVGVPYKSVDETFADGDVKSDFGAGSIEEGQWQVCTDATFKDIKSRNGDNGFLACRSKGAGSGAELMTGLVSTADMKSPAASLYVYNYVDGEDDDNNIIMIQARKSINDDFTTLLEGEVNQLCNGEEGWHRLAVSLGAYAGGIVQVKITAIGGIFTYTCIDDIRVDSMLATDLTISSFSGPDLVTCGDNVALATTIENLGSEESGAFTIELYGDGELIDTKEVKNLAAGGALNIDFNTVMPAMANKEVTYKLVVKSDKDENADNNTSLEWTVEPAESPLPEATDLEGNIDEDVVVLTWNEPDLNSYVPQITDDFEDGEAFSSEYGKWTFVDEDNSPVGGFKDMEIPGITIGTTTGSFWNWDTAALGGTDPTFASHSGTHYLFSLFRQDDGQSDDWAISPELYGNAQTISFYAKSYSALISEKVEVYYSMGSLDPKDFVKVLDATELSNSWTKISAALPEGAKHFAIRSCAEGAFMLMVDDVTYSPAGAKFDGSLLGFDIYRDGVKINKETVEDFEFTDDDIKGGQKYVYNVVAVYDNGISKPSNDVSIDTSGVEEISASAAFRIVEGGVEILATDVETSVCGINGLVYYTGVPSQPTTVNLSNGVYILKIGKRSYKVTIK